MAQSVDGTKRELLHEYWGELEFAERKAKVYLVYTVSTIWRNQKAISKDYYEVDFIKGDQVMESRKMVSTDQDGEVIHSETYAESAAENWCLGVIE